MKNENKPADKTLRQRAEALLRKKVIKPSDYDILTLIQELEIHEIELKIQNEELIMARARAQETAAKYAELFDFAPTGYFILSKGGHIVDLNLHAATMLGKDRSHLADKQLRVFISADSLPAYDSFFDKIFTFKTLQTCEVSLSAVGIPLRFSHISGIATEAGEQCLLTFADITERKKADAARQESEERFFAVTQTASDAIISINQFGKIIGWNRGAEKIFGFSEAEIIGQQVAVIIPERFVQDHFNGIGRMAQGGQPHVIGKTVELYGLHNNGDEFPVELSLSEWKNASGMFFTAIIRDITDRKQAEEELHNKLAELKTMNGHFVGREIKMVELKQEVNELLKKLGENEKYVIHL